MRSLSTDRRTTLGRIIDGAPAAHARLRLTAAGVAWRRARRRPARALPRESCLRQPCPRNQNPARHRRVEVTPRTGSRGPEPSPRMQAREDRHLALHPPAPAGAGSGPRSWRVSPDLKTGLEREARRRKISLPAVLELAAQEWLVSGAARRSESVRQAVRQRLRRHHGVAGRNGSLAPDLCRRISKAPLVTSEAVLTELFHLWAIIAGKWRTPGNSCVRARW